MQFDTLEDRMKFYEGFETQRLVLPGLPIMARLDGRCFHNFTKGMERPYDSRMSDGMVQTTQHLLEESGAAIGYTQSDEITLCWINNDYKSDIFFAGSLFKMTSVLAAIASVYFGEYWRSVDIERAKLRPVFDCRVWTVPNRLEAANVFVWREQDATRNSIEMAAQSVYDHSSLHKKKSADLHEMLFQKGINWNNYPDFFKRGTYVGRRNEVIKFSAEDLSTLPKKHRAHIDPDFCVERGRIKRLELPPLVKIQNRESVLFEGAEPILREEAVA